jgi:hypothetical protein
LRQLRRLKSPRPKQRQQKRRQPRRRKQKRQPKHRPKLSPRLSLRLSLRPRRRDFGLPPFRKTGERMGHPQFFGECWPSGRRSRTRSDAGQEFGGESLRRDCVIRCEGCYSACCLACGGSQDRAHWKPRDGNEINTPTTPTSAKSALVGGPGDTTHNE